jgi:hypothetical protein
MGVGAMRVSREAQSAQSGRDRAVAGSQKRAAEQRLRALPAWASEKRSERRASSFDFGGQSKHNEGSLWLVNPSTFTYPLLFSKWPKSS